MAALALLAALAVFGMGFLESGLDGAMRVV